MPANQKKQQMEVGENAADSSERKDEKCPKQRGRKKKTDSKGPDNVDPPKKRRGKKAGNEVERAKESPKDAPPVTKEAETVGLSSTEPDLSVFSMSQANKFIPRFGKPTKKKANSESTVGSSEKSPDKANDENPSEDMGEIKGGKTNNVSNAERGKEFDDVKVLIEKLEITKDITHIRMEISKENEENDFGGNENVKNTSVKEQVIVEAVLDQDHGQGKEPTKGVGMETEKVPNIEVDLTGIQEGQKEDVILPVQSSTKTNSESEMDTSSTDVQIVETIKSRDETGTAKNEAKEIETTKSEDGTGKAKNKAKESKTDESKDMAAPPCPVETTGEDPATNPVSVAGAGIVTGSAATGAPNNTAVTTADKVPTPGGGDTVPPVPDTIAAPAQLPTSVPASQAAQNPEVADLTGSDTGCFSRRSLETDSHQVTAQSSGAAQSSGTAQCSHPGAIVINKDALCPGAAPPAGQSLGAIQEPRAGIAPRAAQGPGAAPGGGTEQGKTGQNDVVVGSGPDTDLTDSQLEDLDMDMSLDPTQPDTKTSWNSTQSLNQGNAAPKSMAGPLPKPTPPKKKLPDATQKMKSLINELTALNNIVLKAKRDMEIFKRRRQQMAQGPQQPTNPYMYGPY